MRRGALQVLACPECLGVLTTPDDTILAVEDGELTCPAERITFPIVSGVPHLVRAVSKGRIEAFETSYAAAWARSGWGSRDESYFFNLPARDVTGRRHREWRVKARSMDVLLPLLEKVRPGRIVDLGCGMGWLAHQLAGRGHEVYAVDIVRDDVVGLGAASRYVRRGPHFERIWGELEKPPFRDASMDVVVCNASLHYAENLSTVLGEIRRILRLGGLFVVMNSPVHADASSAHRAQEDFKRRLSAFGATEAVTSTYHHFVRSSLESAIRTTIGPTEELHFDPGRRFRLRRRAVQFALRMELASFPVLCARKT